MSSSFRSPVHIIAPNSTTCKWVSYRSGPTPQRRILRVESNMYPLKKGKIAKQAHVGMPEGTYEEEHGRKGFYGKSAHLYHAHPPTGWIRFEGKLRPHCFDLNKLEPSDLQRSRRHARRVSRQRRREAVRLAALAADAVLLPQRRWRRAASSCIAARERSRPISARLPSSRATTSCLPRAVTYRVVPETATISS